MKNKSYVLILFGILGTRLFLNTVVPLMDKTEARYAEIARLMYETQNWITPQIDYGVPFWAKPPLSVWLNALSFHAFGVNEFAVRFPSFLLSLLIWWVLSTVLQHQKQKLLLALVLFTLPQYLLHAGVVSTDMTLLLSLSIIMIGFWKQITSSQKNIWGYLIFVGFGLGLLAKGPITLVLTLPPLFVWVLWFNQWKNVWNRIPLFSGILIFLGIALPWYVLAERATPGFIDYFIVGEHFKRFVDSSWSGDKYGFAKQQPLGIIWVFLVLLSIPWILILIFRSLKSFSIKQLVHQVKSKPWLFFLLAWMLWTPIFFTISKSLIHTYMLPSIPPLALLLIYAWNTFKHPQRNLYVAYILPFLGLVIGLVAIITNSFEAYANTDKYVIENHVGANQSLFYIAEKTYSSQFYSKGKVKVISPSELEAKTSANESFYVLVSKKFVKRNPNFSLSEFEKVDASDKSLLFKTKPSPKIQN